MSLQEGEALHRRPRIPLCDVSRVQLWHFSRRQGETIEGAAGSAANPRWIRRSQRHGRKTTLGWNWYRVMCRASAPGCCAGLLPPVDEFELIPGNRLPFADATRDASREAVVPGYEADGMSTSKARWAGDVRRTTPRPVLRNSGGVFHQGIWVCSTFCPLDRAPDWMLGGWGHWHDTWQASCIWTRMSLYRDLLRGKDGRPSAGPIERSREEPASSLWYQNIEGEVWGSDVCLFYPPLQYCGLDLMSQLDSTRRTSPRSYHPGTDLFRCKANTNSDHVLNYAR